MGLDKTESSVTLIAHSTLDIEHPVDDMPILAARVSHGQDCKTGKDSSKDEKLMKYLAEHHHTSVFEHTSATFKIVCPLFVAREWHRHRTQSYNEISMRYTSDPVGKMWYPKAWRIQDGDNHQSSNGEHPTQGIANELLQEAYGNAIEVYNKLITLGYPKEQARAVVPMGNTTEFYATANLLNWSKFCKLRMAEDAQEEIRELALQVDKSMLSLYPKTWKAVMEN